MKRSYIFVIFIVIIFGLSSKAFATTTDSINNVYRDSALQFSNQISKNLTQFSDWEKIRLENEIYLYDYSGSKINAVSYDVYGFDNAELGYIIVDSDTSKVVEFSKYTSPYSMLLECYKENNNLTGKISDEYCIYYPGQHSFAAKINTTNDYKIFEFTQDQNMKITNRFSDDNLSSNTPKSSGEYYKLLSGVPDANFTISCIPTAIGNIIGYWDTHGYPNLIVSPKTIYSAISEINTNLINICGNNVSNSAIPGATQQYCRAAGRYPNNFNVTNIWNPSYTQFKTQIDNNRPALVGFSAAGPYQGGHMTAGVGYYYDVWFPQDKYIYVHDAWSSTPVDYFVLWGSYNDFIATIVP